MTVSVVIAAGGRGTRMGAGFNKVFMKLADEEVILHTMRAFEANKDVDEIIVIIGEDDKERVTNIAEAAHITKLSAVTAGGESRCCWAGWAPWGREAQAVAGRAGAQTGGVERNGDTDADRFVYPDFYHDRGGIFPAAQGRGG